MDLQRTIKIERNILIWTLITPIGTKTNSYNNCNSTEMPFDDNDRQIFVNSKYYDINELNALNNKANYCRILHLNPFRPEPGQREKIN